MTTFDPSTLTDDALIVALRALANDSNSIESALIAHLAEVDVRSLHLGRAHSSLFAYCTLELGFSESMTFNRILVARASRAFPLVLERLKNGAIHLSGLRILVPHLTPDNHLELLDESTRKSKREIEALVARRFPKPPVPDVIRKLPEPRTLSLSIPPVIEASLREVVSEPHAAPPRAPSGPAQEAMRPEPAPARPAPSRPAVVEPLSETQFKVQFTADQALSEKLKEARDLLRHQVPDGSLATIIERALDLLIRETKKTRFGVGRAPRARDPRETTPGSRHVPDDLKRQVYERDGGQCTFVDKRGHRCPEKGGLEIDHIHGFARDPTHSLEGLRLLCRAHNAYEAARLYGAAFMDEKRRRSSSASSAAAQKDRPDLAPGAAASPG